MIRRIVAVSATTLLLLLGVHSAQAQMRPKLACFPLVARSIEAMAYNESISSLLVNTLDREGYFEIFERKKIEGVIEQEGIRLDTLNRNILFEVGSRAGIDFVIYGTVTRLDGKLVLDVNLVNTRSRGNFYNETLRIDDAETAGKLRELAGVLIRKAKDFYTVVEVKPVINAAPPPPGDIKANGTPKSIRLRWNPGEQVVGYKVFRAASAAGPFVQIASTTAPSFSDENLEMNVSFLYKVSAIGRTGIESPQSEAVGGKTSAAPQPPIFMNIEPNVKGATLTWCERPYSGSDPALVPSGFRIYRRGPGDSDFREIARTEKSQLTYGDDGLADGARYLYLLTAFNSAGGESEYSATLAVTTVAGAGRLSAESGLIRKVRLNWEAHPFEQVAGYAVYRSAKKDGEYALLARVNGRLTTTYADTGLEDMATWWYKVAAAKKEGVETGSSEPVSAVTRPRPPQPANPAATGGLPRRVQVSWSAVGVPEDEIAGYRIYRSESAKGEGVKIGEVAASKTVWADQSPPLKDQTEYFYTVTAFNSAGAESPRSETAAAVTKKVPARPAGLTAVSAQVKKVTLSWGANPESDLRHYEVYRKTGEASLYERIAKVSTTSYVDSGLNDGTEYSYSLTAVDADGLESPTANPVAATTKPVPRKVSGVKVEASGGKALLSWNRSEEKDVQGYAVYRKGFLGMAQKISTVEAPGCTVEGKGKLELYVAAVDADGLEGEASETVSVELQ